MGTSNSVSRKLFREGLSQLYSAPKYRNRKKSVRVKHALNLLFNLIPIRGAGLQPFYSCNESIHKLLFDNKVSCIMILNPYLKKQIKSNQKTHDCIFSIIQFLLISPVNSLAYELNFPYKVNLSAKFMDIKVNFFSNSKNISSKFEALCFLARQEIVSWSSRKSFPNKTIQSAKSMDFNVNLSSNCRILLGVWSVVLPAARQDDIARSYLHNSKYFPTYHE